MSPGPRITDLPRPVNSVAFSADGSLLAAGSDDGTVRLWNMSTGAPVGEPMSGHLGPVYGVAFSPVGSLLASSGEDGTVRFWDPASSLEVGGPLQAEPSAAVSMKFSPDAQHLVTVGADGKAQVFDAVWDMRQACDLAAPFVSREQLTPYLPADWSIKGCALGN
jgi:WD40 repeat protein